jgi:hypothetical protein
MQPQDMLYKWFVHAVVSSVLPSGAERSRSVDDAWGWRRRCGYALQTDLAARRAKRCPEGVIFMLQRLRNFARPYRSVCLCASHRLSVREMSGREEFDRTSFLSVSVRASLDILEPHIHSLPAAVSCSFARVDTRVPTHLIFSFATPPCSIAPAATRCRGDFRASLTVPGSRHQRRPAATPLWPPIFHQTSHNTLMDPGTPC